MKIRIELYYGMWMASRGNARVTLGPTTYTPLWLAWNKAVYWFYAPAFDGAEYARIARGGGV